MLLAAKTAESQAQLLQRALDHGLGRHFSSWQRLLSGLRMRAKPQSQHMQLLASQIQQQQQHQRAVHAAQRTSTNQASCLLGCCLRPVTGTRCGLYDSAEAATRLNIGQGLNAGVPASRILLCSSPRIAMDAKSNRL